MLTYSAVHHAMDYQVRICATNHDQHELDYAVVLIRHSILLLRQDLQEMVEELLNSQDVDVQTTFTHADIVGML